MYDAGMGTTTGMWELLSDILAENEEKLPDSLNEAIYALRDGNARVVLIDEEQLVRSEQMLKIGPTQEQIDVVQDECNARIDDGYSRGEGMTYEEGVLAAILWLRGEADNPLEGGDD